ncbi:MAG: hypothetical protein ACLR94_04825 [Acutalibacteraceae bacterium]
MENVGFFVQCFQTCQVPIFLPKLLILNYNTPERKSLIYRSEQGATPLPGYDLRKISHRERKEVEKAMARQIVAKAAFALAEQKEENIL